jgi:hypothetical protein
MTTNQTPEQALDAAVERVMGSSAMHTHKEKGREDIACVLPHCPQTIAKKDAAIRTELEQAYAAGRRDALGDAREAVDPLCPIGCQQVIDTLATPTETKP